MTTAQWLFSHGANIHIDQDDAMSFACERGDLITAQWLFSRGAKINASDEYPLYRACKNGHLHIVKWLASQGANVRAGKDGPLAVASHEYFDNFETVQWLISSGANIAKSNISYQKRYWIEIRLAMLLGEHRRIGENSAIKRWLHHNLSELHLIDLIFQYIITV